MPAPVEAVLLGAGNRGWRVYGEYALTHPDRLRFVGVVEPDAGRRQRFAVDHGLAPDRQFDSWQALANRPRLAAAAVNATLDATHHASTLGLLQCGYDVLLEKPIATTPEQCLDLAQTAERLGRKLQISHVLRYAPFFRRIYELLRADELGDIVAVDWRENLVYWHYAHSFVRGNWRSASSSGPMLLTKCCHDLDLLVWLFGTCERIASFGEQRYFTSSRVGPEVPPFCLDGCPRSDTCLYYAPRLYLDRLADNADHFTVAAIALDRTEAGVMRALRDGPYGRCVYRCDNDVVDHQVTSLRFAGGQTVSLTMQGASHVEGRTVRIDGMQATLLANEARNEIAIVDHGTGQRRIVDVPPVHGGHGGGDWGLIGAFVAALRGERPDVLTSARESVESHLLAFAGEEARVSGETIDMNAYRARIEQHLATGALG